MSTIESPIQRKLKQKKRKEKQCRFCSLYTPLKDQVNLGTCDKFVYSSALFHPDHYCYD